MLTSAVLTKHQRSPVVDTITRTEEQQDGCAEGVAWLWNLDFSPSSLLSASIGGDAATGVK